MCRPRCASSLASPPTMDARDASGPTFARHVGSRLYRGESFALQVDAHITFVPGWDVKFVEMWSATRNEYAILTTAPGFRRI